MGRESDKKEDEKETTQYSLKNAGLRHESKSAEPRNSFCFQMSAANLGTFLFINNKNQKNMYIFI